MWYAHSQCSPHLTRYWALCQFWEFFWLKGKVMDTISEILYYIISTYLNSYLTCSGWHSVFCRTFTCLLAKQHNCNSHMSQTSVYPSVANEGNEQHTQWAWSVFAHLTVNDLKHSWWLDKKTTTCSSLVAVTVINFTWYHLVTQCHKQCQHWTDHVWLLISKPQ